MNNNRIKYLDFCKFLAMFLVTWDHAAQVISNQTFNNVLWGRLVTVHMPLFFIISGYLLNIEKIRAVKTLPYIKNKFKQLMMPAIAWTALFCLLTITTKGILTYLTFYWYLFSLFASFIIIRFFCTIFKSDLAVIILSTLTVMCTPYMDTANLNFMFPFLWFGFMLKTHPPKNSLLWFVILLVVAISLLLIWNWDYSVYLSRFNTAHLTLDMTKKCVIRFAMGISASYVIIWLAKMFENSKFIKIFSRFGQYTLITYLASLVIFGVMNKYIYIGIEQPILLEVLSFILCTITYVVCIYLQKLLSGNKYTRQIFLGLS